MLAETTAKEPDVPKATAESPVTDAAPSKPRSKKKKSKTKSKAARRSAAPPAPRESARNVSRDERSSVPAPSKTGRGKKRSPDDTNRYTLASDPGAPRRMWISLAVVVAVVIALALAVSAR